MFCYDMVECKYSIISEPSKAARLFRFDTVRPQKAPFFDLAHNPTVPKRYRDCSEKEPVEDFDFRSHACLTPCLGPRMAGCPPVDIALRACPIIAILSTNPRGKTGFPRTGRLSIFPPILTSKRPCFQDRISKIRPQMGADFPSRNQGDTAQNLCSSGRKP